jgi:hypothetical protein
MSKYCGNQMRLTPKGNYGIGPHNAGSTTVNAPVLPSTTMVPYPTSAGSRWEDGTVVKQYKNPDAINVGQGKNHKGNI